MSSGTESLLLDAQLANTANTAQTNPQRDAFISGAPPMYPPTTMANHPHIGNNDRETYQNLFITKLHRNIKDQDLLALFAPFGGKSATVMLDAKTGKSKGFGFVLFDTEEEGKRAHEAMHQKQITVAGCAAQLSIFPSKHDAKNAVDPSPSLYVRNVPIHSPKEEVERMLEQFGSVAFCAMREEPDGLPVWVILVEYDCQLCADNALSHLRHNTTLYPQGPLPVIAKYAKAMDRKRSLTSRKRQNASKNCPFRATRYAAGPNATGGGVGPLGSAGNSYGSSFNEGSGTNSYGTGSSGSDSMSSLWAAQLSMSQPHYPQQHVPMHHGGPIPQFVTTTTNPNGSTTTTAYYGDSAIPPQLLFPGGVGGQPMPHANPPMAMAHNQGGMMGSPPSHFIMGGQPQQSERPSAVSMANPSTMFVFQPNGGIGAPQQAPPQGRGGFVSQGIPPPLYGGSAHQIPLGAVGGSVGPVPQNVSQFVTFAPNPNPGAGGGPNHPGMGTNFYGMPPQGYH